VYFSEYPGFHRRTVDLARFVQANVVSFKLSGLAKHPIVMSPAGARLQSICMSIREARMLLNAIPKGRRTQDAVNRLRHAMKLAAEDEMVGWVTWPQ
jgi:hypothetical protein